MATIPGRGGKPRKAAQKLTETEQAWFAEQVATQEEKDRQRAQGELDTLYAGDEFTRALYGSDWEPREKARAKQHALLEKIHGDAPLEVSPEEIALRQEAMAEIRGLRLDKEFTEAFLDPGHAGHEVAKDIHQRLHTIAYAPLDSYEPQDVE